MLLKSMFLLLITVVLWSRCSAVTAGERLAPMAGRAGRSVTMATHGMVATSHPLAVQIGLNVLKNGGNAVDAAIAVNAALGLMEPMSCGIGGDLYALVWDAKTQKLYGLNASGRSPYRGDTRAFRREGTQRDSHVWAAQLVGAGLRRWLGGICASVSAPVHWRSCWSRASAMPRRVSPSVR